MSSSPSPAPAAPPPGSSRQRETTLQRFVPLTLALVSLVIAWFSLGTISRTDPWYRNTDMNIHNMVDALALNSGQPPQRLDQPGTPTKFLLALDYRVLHLAGRLPVWNMEQLGANPAPLAEIRNLIPIGRLHSRVMVILCILGAAALTCRLTRHLESTCLTIILLCGSSGLLFHGLLNRTELLCVFLGNILALLCTYHATESRHWVKSHLWLFIAGLLAGIAILEKLPGLGFLATCHAWCWLAAWCAEKRPAASPSREQPAVFSLGLLPAAAGASVLWMLFTVLPQHTEFDPVSVMRLRATAVFIALLPLLALFTARPRLWSFLLDRTTELAFLGAGALAAIPLCYLLLRTVLPGPAASDYLAQNIQMVFNPGPLMSVLLAAKPDISREFMLFFKESPVLFLGASALALGVVCVRSIPRSNKAFIALLLFTGFAITLLMSRRYYVAQYSIFPQVPLFLVIALSFAALLGAWRHEPTPGTGSHWAFPLVLTSAVAFMLTAYFRVQPKYYNYQNDATLPVNDFTLTFLFDHDVHPAGYLKVMREHYGDREQFAEALQLYLADPANRY